MFDINSHFAQSLFPVCWLLWDRLTPLLFVYSSSASTFTFCKLINVSTKFFLFWNPFWSRYPSGVSAIFILCSLSCWLVWLGLAADSRAEKKESSSLIFINVYSARKIPFYDGEWKRFPSKLICTSSKPFTVRWITIKQWLSNRAPSHRVISKTEIILIVN